MQLFPCMLPLSCGSPVLKAKQPGDRGGGPDGASLSLFFLGFWRWSFHSFFFTFYFSPPLSLQSSSHPEEHITHPCGAVTWGCCPFVINDIDSQWVEAPDCLCANELKSEQQHLDPPPIHHRPPPRTLLMTSAIFGGSCRDLDFKNKWIIIMIMS